MRKSVWSMAIVLGIALLVVGSSLDAREGPKNFVVLLSGTDDTPEVRTFDGVDYVCYDVDLVNPTTGRRIGDAADCLEFPASVAPIGDDGGFGINNLTFFDLPGGTVVSLSRTTIQPVESPAAGVATHITGEVDGSDNIVPGLGTGRFHGATGSTRLNGTVDMSAFPTITFSCLFVISID